MTTFAGDWQRPNYPSILNETNPTRRLARCAGHFTDPRGRAARLYFFKVFT
jgi:hypothetical protein